MAKTSILISGAGIAGATLAYWLRARGFEPVLVERSPTFRTGGYILDFWGVGLDVAERMGLLPVLRQDAYVIDALRYVDATGRTRANLRASAVRDALGGRFVSVRRGDLARAIYGLIDGQVEALFGDWVQAIDENDDGVEVVFALNGKRRFDLVVGCGGLHSPVRRLVFGPEAQFERYLGYFTASFATSHYPHRDPQAYVSYTAPGRQISRYALRDDRTAFFFVWTQARKPAVDVRDVNVQRRLVAKAFATDLWMERPEIIARLAACDDLYFDAVSQVRLPAWSRGRVALVGDAAFCPSLLAGEGSSLAMAGAYVLAGELERAGGDHRAAFARYEGSLRPLIERKQAGARRFASTFAPRTRAGLLLRDQMIRAMNLPVIGPSMIRRMAADRFALPEYPTRPVR